MEIFQENLTAAVKDTLTTVLGSVSEIWHGNFTLRHHNLGILRLFACPLHMGDLHYRRPDCDGCRQDFPGSKLLP
eukprot:6180392-Pleurochrysis_carterae.AAC.3